MQNFDGSTLAWGEEQPCRQSISPSASLVKSNTSSLTLSLTHTPYHLYLLLKSKELKTKISHADSLILSHSTSIYVSLYLYLNGIQDLKICSHADSLILTHSISISTELSLLWTGLLVTSRECCGESNPSHQNHPLVSRRISCWLAADTPTRK